MATNFINNLLSQLKGGSKDVVHVSVSVQHGLEVIKIDPETSTIVKYGKRPLEYNDSLKEIKDYSIFKNELSELFKELGIPQNSNIYLSLPTVFVGKVDLPGLLNDEGVSEALISEAEQSYIFRRVEPMIAWYSITDDPEVETKTIIYSAVQKPAVDKITELLTEMGATLIGLEPALMSTLRALKYIHKVSDQIDNEKIWTLMKISSTGYSLTTMYGEKAIEYYEEPLALKTYEGEEIYEVIFASVQIALLNAQVDSLFVISETDLISAENMAGRIPIDGDVIFLENNRYRKQNYLEAAPNIPEEALDSLSLEIIGTGLKDIADYSINLDFIGDSVQTGNETFILIIGNKEFTLSEALLKKYLLILAAALIVPALILTLVATSLNKSNQTKLNAINEDIKKVETEIETFKKRESADGRLFDEKTEIEIVLKNNKNKLKAYSAIGESVPRNLWLTYFLAKGEGKIALTGVATNVEDIYVFYRNMKDSLLDSQLRLNKLRMESGSIDDAISSSLNYSFEITNMTDAELNPPSESDKKDDNNNAPAKKGKDSSAQKNSGSERNPSENKGTSVKDLEVVEVH